MSKKNSFGERTFNLLVNIFVGGGIGVGVGIALPFLAFMVIFLVGALTMLFGFDVMESVFCYGGCKLIESFSPAYTNFNKYIFVTCTMLGLLIGLIFGLKGEKNGKED